MVSQRSPSKFKHTIPHQEGRSSPWENVKIALNTAPQPPPHLPGGPPQEASTKGRDSTILVTAVFPALAFPLGGLLPALLSQKFLPCPASTLVRTEAGRASGGRMEEIKDSPLALEKLPAKQRKNAKPNHFSHLRFNAVPLGSGRWPLPSGKERAGSSSLGLPAGQQS